MMSLRTAGNSNLFVFFSPINLLKHMTGHKAVSRFRSDRPGTTSTFRDFFFNPTTHFLKVHEQHAKHFRDQVSSTRSGVLLHDFERGGYKNLLGFFFSV
jgi:hypothetical protein